MPPFIRCVMEILGGFRLTLIPMACSSSKIFVFCSMPLLGSRMMRMRSETLATARTCRPFPCPEAAPSTIPGRSSSWILASLMIRFPGMQDRVVNSRSLISDLVDVSAHSRLDFPTDGKPTRETLAFPHFSTANPTLPPVFSVG